MINEFILDAVKSVGIDAVADFMSCHGAALMSCR